MRPNWELIGVWIVLLALGCTTWWAIFKLGAYLIQRVFGG